MQSEEPNASLPASSEVERQAPAEQQQNGQNGHVGAEASPQETPSYPQSTYPSYPSFSAYPPPPAYPQENELGAPTTPAHPLYGSYPGSYPSSPQGSWPVGAPQPGLVYPPRRRSRLPWLYAASVVVLVVLLAIALASALGRAGTQPNSSSSAVGGTQPTVAVPPSAQDLQQTIINVIQTAQPSVVEVTSQGQGGEAIGSGVILRPDGYIVTNDHVVRGFSNYAVTLSNGKQDNATLKGEDPQDDLAVLQINESNLRAINFADSAKVSIGQFAVAIGNPLGLTQSATFGIVSALNRSASEGQQGPANLLTGLIQTSAPINPGNSGGALVDLQGQLIGIPTLGVQDQQTGGSADGIGFAIPSDRVKFVAQQLIQNGKLTSTGQGFLGIRGEDVTPNLAAADNLPVQSGVLVTGFVNDSAGTSPGQQAGLRVGDIITGVNGQTISSNADLASALISQSPGTSVTLTAARGSGQQTIHVTLGERPASLQG